MTRRTAIKTGAVLLGLTLTSCTPEAAPPPPSSAAPTTRPPGSSPSATFNFGTASQPLGLDPALANDVESQRVTRQILEGLVGVNQTTGEPTPLLATEWTASRGRPLLHLHPALRRQVPRRLPLQRRKPSAPTSSAGSTSPAALRKQAPGTTFKGVFKEHSDQAGLSVFKACTALSSLLVRIDLTERFTGFLQALTLPAFAISSPKALAAGRADILTERRGSQALSAYATHPVGTGPYRFSAWDSTGVTLLTQQGLLGRPRRRSAPSTSSRTTIRRPGFRPCLTARSTAMTQ